MKYSHIYSHLHSPHSYHYHLELLLICSSICHRPTHLTFFFFFNDPPTPEISPLSLHDALPIYRPIVNGATMLGQSKTAHQAEIDAACELIDFFRFNVHYAERIYAEQPLKRKKSISSQAARSEEHTSELQSQSNLVCRLLLEKKK